MTDPKEILAKIERGEVKTLYEEIIERPIVERARELLVSHNSEYWGWAANPAERLIGLPVSLFSALCDEVERLSWTEADLRKTLAEEETKETIAVEEALRLRARLAELELLEASLTVPERYVEVVNEAVVEDYEKCKGRVYTLEGHLKEMATADFPPLHKPKEYRDGAEAATEYFNQLAKEALEDKEKKAEPSTTDVNF